MTTILLVGGIGCGKTTLLQRLQGDEITYSKTQSIHTQGKVIDTPGEYLEMPWFKHSLRMASFDAQLVVLLASATVNEAKFPPGFTTFFMPPSIGVVTKVDIAEPPQISLAADYLRLAGALEVFEVSAITGQGIAALEARLA